MIRKYKILIRLFFKRHIYCNHKNIYLVKNVCGWCRECNKTFHVDNMRALFEKTWNDAYSKGMKSGVMKGIRKSKNKLGE